MMRDQELAGLAMTLGRDANIQITVSGDVSYCKPDGSHINIARMPSTPLGRMLMTGLVFHEVGHKNYTKGDKPAGLLGDMMNVIEDIRVDRETIKARPGTCFNLEAVTTHYVNKGSLEPKNLPHALLGKVMAFGFGQVLMQQAILPLETLCNEMMDDAFGQEFIEDVEAIIKDIPKLRNTTEATDMAQQLIDLLIQQQTPPVPPPQHQHQQDERDVDETQEQNGGQEKGDDSGDQERSHSDDTDSQQQADPDDGEGVAEENSSPQPDDEPQHQDEATMASAAGGNGGGNRPTPEEIAQMIKIKTGYGDLSALIQAELNVMADSTPYDKRADIPSLPFIGKLKAVHGKLNEVEALAASSRMRAKMMGMLQAIKRRPKSFGLSGRKLVTRRLPWLSTGDPRIFSKKVEAVEINTAVTVLLDLSGSMGDSYEVANAAAFALHTTLFGLKGVAVCSLEFSGKDRQPEVNLLVEFGRKPLSENFNHRPFDSTPTHVAIWATRVMLLQRHEPRKIMLILTDGCPDSGPDTKSATQRAMKDGIEIAAIGIMDDNVRHYWDNHKIIESVQELPAAMFVIMEGLLTQKATTNGRGYAK